MVLPEGVLVLILGLVVDGGVAGQALGAQRFLILKQGQTLYRGVKHFIQVKVKKRMW